MSLSKAPEDIWSETAGSALENAETASAVHFTAYPNKWSKLREPLREYFAEFLGVMILIIFGTGVDCQVVLSTVESVAGSQQGSYLSISFGWAIGTALGVWVSGGISGGHINPAVTIALATFRGFPWKKVPGFIIAQILGGFAGCGIVYGNYHHAITLFEGGSDIRTRATASLFTTYALDYMTSVSCFFSEFMATAVLLIVVMAIGDKKNGPPPAGLAPLVLFILILGEGACLGMQTAYAINPARDLGPRMFLAAVGYGKQVFTYRSQYWLWCPIIAPIIGALVGVGVYDTLLYTGGDSIVNKPNAAARRHHEEAANQQRQKAPLGNDQIV